MSNLNSHAIAALLLSVPDSPLYFAENDCDVRFGGIRVDHIGVWLLEYAPTPEEIEAASLRAWPGASHVTRCTCNAPATDDPRCITAGEAAAIAADVAIAAGEALTLLRTQGREDF